MFRIIFYSAAFGLGGAMIVNSFLNMLEMPDVHFSYSSGECVRVLNYTDEVFTCENLPERFHHVWVE